MEHLKYYINHMETLYIKKNEVKEHTQREKGQQTEELLYLCRRQPTSNSHSLLLLSDKCVFLASNRWATFNVKMKNVALCWGRA